MAIPASSSSNPSSHHVNPLSRAQTEDYNSFVLEFSGHPSASYGNLRGSINNQVAEVFTECVLQQFNPSRYSERITRLNCPEKLKSKALTLSRKYFEKYRKTSFSLNPEGIQQLYKQKLVIRTESEAALFEEVKDRGGVANVGYQIKQKDAQARVGIMIAANSGLPGGALAFRPNAITENDLNLITQEESTWANVVLTNCKNNPRAQQAFHDNTIGNQWGMVNKSDTMTKQGIDFTKTMDASSYNSSYIIPDQLISEVSVNPATQKKHLNNGEVYYATFVFADSVNANPEIGSETGTMKRTLNNKAVNDYDFFCKCIKMKLRSALDAMASESVTYPLIARLSCGIYAHPSRKNAIRNDFSRLLIEVLSESVGPRDEKRGQYFTQVIMPKI
jgi:hypothetical protein